MKGWGSNVTCSSIYSPMFTQSLLLLSFYVSCLIFLYLASFFLHILLIHDRSVNLFICCAISHIPGSLSSRCRSCFAFNIAKGCGAPSALNPRRDAAEDGGKGAPGRPGCGNMGNGGWAAAAAAAAAGPNCCACICCCKKKHINYANAN